MSAATPLTNDLSSATSLGTYKDFSNLFKTIAKQYSNEELQTEVDISSTNVDDILSLFSSGVVAKEVVDISELIRGMSQEEIIVRGVHDVNFFAKLMFPETAFLNFPPLLVAVFSMWCKALHQIDLKPSELKIANSLPRGFAKTLLLKLFALYCILYSRCKYILYVANLEDEAASLVNDLTNALSQPHVRTIYGSWDADVSMNNKKEKKFRYRGRSLAIVPKAVEATVRGTTKNEARPDIIIVDDIQQEDNAKSEVRSTALISWVFNTLIPAKSQFGCLILVAGNNYPYDGNLMSAFAKLEGWIHIRLGAITKDGKSLWEDIHPIKAILQSYLAAIPLGHKRFWLAQYMAITERIPLNDFDVSKLVTNFERFVNFFGITPENYHHKIVGKFLIVDLAGGSETSDDHCFSVVDVLHVVDGNGKYYHKPVCSKIISEKHTPITAAAATIKLIKFYGIYDVFVENVAYQGTFNHWFIYYAKINNIDISGVTIRGIYPSKGKKVNRILSSFRSVEEGETLLGPDAAQVYAAQVRKYDPAAPKNEDDALDVVQYIVPIANKYMINIIRSFYTATQQALTNKLSKPNVINIPTRKIL